MNNLDVEEDLITELLFKSALGTFVSIHQLVVSWN